MFCRDWSIEHMNCWSLGCRVLHRQNKRQGIGQSILSKGSHKQYINCSWLDCSHHGKQGTCLHHILCSHFHTKHIHYLLCWCYSCCWKFYTPLDIFHKYFHPWILSEGTTSRSQRPSWYGEDFVSYETPVEEYPTLFKMVAFSLH